MPGIQDEYFPLNFNVRLYDYENVDFNGRPHIINRTGGEQVGGKYETTSNDGSGSTTTTRRTRNVSLNEMTMPPENEVQEDDDDDSISVQSSDIDVDLDDMDTLVLSIHEKLRMGPNYSSNSNTVHSFWEESYDNEDSNQSGCSTSSHCSISRRKRVRPFSWKHNQSSRHHSLATIQKHNNRTAHHCHHWWTSKSFSDISQRRKGVNNPDSPHNEDPYHVLKELIDSGSLIKEAVRRINTKRIGCRVNTTSHSHQLGSIVSPNSSSAKMFTYRNENSEVSYPTLPLSAQ